MSGDAGRESEGKKTLYWYTRLGKIAVVETVFTHGRGGPELRPFSASAEVVCRGCSPALQRAMTDFGADHGVGHVPKKLQDH